MYSENDYNEGDKNPNTDSFTCLELFCKFKGWQGGTIHQAFSEFESMPKIEQKDFCRVLSGHVFRISDMHNFESFIKASRADR